MRIVGGAWRGRPLTALGKGDALGRLRPTTDRVRESLFNLLAHGGFGDPVSDARVLDLFAGTGALALEALSRGAETATLVERGRVGAKLIRQNIDTLGANARLLTADATRLPRGMSHDLVFLDPPYGQGLGERALRSAAEGGWLCRDALIVWEESAPKDAPDGFRKVDDRRFGDTYVTMLRFSDVPDAL